MRRTGLTIALTWGKAAAVLAASLTLATLTAASAPPTASPSLASEGEKRPGVRKVVFVGSNWAGTVDVLKPRGKFRKIAQLNIIPDKEEREAEIYSNPDRTAFFLGIRELVGEGHDQYVDDMYSSPDGRLLIASRPSFADVVALNIRTGKIVWRFPVDGYRSDHMALSPDGRHVAVSASTGNVVHILDVETGEEVGRFESGDSPHENVYSLDGKRIYHASIGRVYTASDRPPAEQTTKGARYFQIVSNERATDDDPDTDPIIERLDMGKKLEEAGHPNMSSAVRPMALMKDERKVYFQVSFFHGFVEYNLKKDRVIRVVRLPVSEETKDMPREQYLLDSAHHGISLSGDEDRLCVAGTMSDYAAIVDRKKPRKRKLFKNVGEKPYWATTSGDGEKCYVSWSGTDAISVFDYDKRKEIAHVAVNDHPQRIREGFVRKSWYRDQTG